MPRIINALYRLAGLAQPLGPLILKRRLQRGKEDAGRLTERMGIAGQKRPDGPLVWLHGASVGEAMSALAIIHRLLAANPALNILLTTGTVTSARLMAKHLPDRAVHQYIPLDFPGYTDKFIRHWQPDTAIWIESEIWPGLITATAGTDCRMALLNARMSQRSHQRWRKIPGTIRNLLASFELILGQTPEFADRFSELTGRRIDCLGNLKHCADPLPCDDTTRQEIQNLIGNRPCFTAASLHPGEDETVIAAHQKASEQVPGLLTILVPRHPDRGEQIALKAQSAGLSVARRAAGEQPGPDTGIYIADTLGEMGVWYRLAAVSLVGGSLRPGIGGHNMLEPARLNSAIISGRHTENFRDVLSLLESAKGVIIADTADQIAQSVADLMHNDTQRKVMTTAAKGTTDQQDRVLDDLLERLQFLLPADNRNVEQR